MTLASTYSLAVQAADASHPTVFAGPGGLLTAQVDDNGNCLLIVEGRQFTAPAAAIVAFATWVNATFT